MMPCVQNTHYQYAGSSVKNADKDGTNDPVNIELTVDKTLISSKTSHAVGNKSLLSGNAHGSSSETPSVVVTVELEICQHLVPMSA